MKTIIKIAKLELGTLFFSPIAWFLAIIFLVQCAMAYMGAIEGTFTMLDLGGGYAAAVRDLTQRVFGGAHGLVAQMMNYGYLYLPLLTMGLISREISSGTIKLLYSSPVKVSQIVLGKFGAMLIYNLILTLIMGLFMVTGLFNIPNAEVGLMLSGLLGMYLLLCTYAAIGLFMSSLTSYQVVAALSTLVILAVLNYVGGLWQGVDVVRDFTYFFSLNRHIGAMLMGLITSVDVLYFTLISAMFLVFTMLKMQSERESKPGIIVAGRYIGVVVVCATLGYITSRPLFRMYCDATDNKRMTLTPKSQEIIGKMKDEPLEITSYINLLDGQYWNGTPEMRQTDLQRWEPYIRFKPDIKFNYVYYWDEPSKDQMIYKQYPGQSLKQIAEHFAKSMHADLKKFKAPEEIRKIIDLSAEENRYVIQLKYKGKTTFLRLFRDMIVFPSEQEVDAGLERLMIDKFPKIAFLKGEAERNIDRSSPRDYSGMANTKNFRNSLINQGFDIVSLSLESQEIPNDITALVVADPRNNFTQVVMAKLQAYINKGGNLMIAGDVGKQAVLNPLLATLGVRMLDGILIQKSLKNLPAYVGSLFTKEAVRVEKNLLVPFQDSARVTMPKAVALSWSKTNPYTVTPLLMTDVNSTWNKKGSFSEDSVEVNFSAKGGDEMTAFPTALALTRQVNGKQQRIMVTGDADFPANGELGRMGNANFYFATTMFGWFAYERFPIDASRPRGKDNSLNLTDEGVKRLNIVCLWVLPGLLFICGAVFLIRRKRK